MRVLPFDEKWNFHVASFFYKQNRPIQAQCQQIHVKFSSKVQQIYIRFTSMFLCFLQLSKGFHHNLETSKYITTPLQLMISRCSCFRQSFSIVIRWKENFELIELRRENWFNISPIVRLKCSTPISGLHTPDELYKNQSVSWSKCLPVASFEKTLSSAIMMLKKKLRENDIGDHATTRQSTGN